MPTLQSYLAGHWQGEQAAQALFDANTGETIAHTHSEAINAQAAVAHARRVGQTALKQLNFQSRGSLLRALAKHLLAHKESLYTLSLATGATRNDSWVDIEGGIATLNAYANIAAQQLPSSNLVHEGPAHSLSKSGQFMGSHILTPKLGVAVHINAFNFPIWGALEKFAPSFVAGVPSIIKPASATSYLTEAMVRLIVQSGLLPEGSLQLIIGSTRDLFDHLDGQDCITFTGSATTAQTLRSHPNVLKNSIPFNAEADSLNAAILGEDAVAGDPQFAAFVREVSREMTVKAGQKCTAIRRIIVPARLLADVQAAIIARLDKVVIGDTRLETSQMGALASREQLADVTAQIKRLQASCELVYQGQLPATHAQGAFIAPHLLLAHEPLTNAAAHSIEAFGPVSTLMPYQSTAEAISLARLGQGSLVASVVTADAHIARELVLGIAAYHGRVHLIEGSNAKDSTGHGAPLPSLKHGGPGRAGGGEELAGLHAVTHYLQRTALQASPTMLMALTGEYVRGAVVEEASEHPFRKSFDEINIGYSLLTHRRTVSEADIVNFGGISGDYFYMHFDELAAKDSLFGKRIAHGYFVLSAAAGLFVYPGVGPVLANYGLDELRFVKPVGIGDTIRARLTCKRKVDRAQKPGEAPQGVVVWDVAVSNQLDELVASYDILTLVKKS
jgi:oxepin-CoA hydrolase / 3-oxo-5,6-dehydrosuberyl-CoA semialdehyde dehydrogenase